MKKIFLPVFLSLMMMTSCENTFETHPYNVNFDGDTHINEKNIAVIESNFAEKETLRVALISDSHLWLSDASDEVADVNNRNVDFVIHCGDLTDTGTAKEYEWSRDVLQSLNYPYVALIGNHDFLGTGDQAYSEMYGEMNFSFIAGRVKFVCLNTNATEYDYIAAVPNLDWMEEETTKDSARFDRTIVIMHAPPYNEQFNNNVCKAFRKYLDLFPGLMCCINGHVHGNDIVEYYNDGLLFYSIDCAEHRNYRIMTITPDGYEMEDIYF